jgi:hypothetical protein
MNEMGWGKHAAVVVAMVINLWVGGDLVEAWLGHLARSVFELVLILGWLTVVVGTRAPLPWRRSSDEGEQRERREHREP